jgi:hypothetical protein
MTINEACCSRNARQGGHPHMLWASTAGVQRHRPSHVVEAAPARVPASSGSVLFTRSNLIW